MITTKITKNLTEIKPNKGHESIPNDNGIEMLLHNMKSLGVLRIWGNKIHRFDMS